LEKTPQRMTIIPARATIHFWMSGLNGNKGISGINGGGHTTMDWYLGMYTNWPL
jgi:hypothetical protein